MKKIISLFLIIMFALSFASCGKKESGSKDSENSSQEESSKAESKTEINYSANETDVTVIKTTAKTEYDKSYNEAVKTLTDDQKAVLDVIYQEIITKLDDASGNIEEVKKELNNYYKQLNEAIDLAKETATSLEEQKNKALKELEEVYNAVVAVANPTTVEYVKSLYNQAVEQIKNVVEAEKAKIPQIKQAFAEAAKEYVTTIIDETLALTIETARKELKKAYDKAMLSIEDNDVKDKVTTLYNKIDLMMAGIIDASKSQELLEQYIKQFSDDLLQLLKDEAALTLSQYKTIAIEKFDSLYNEATSKITDATAKSILNDFYAMTVKSINDCTSIEEVEAIYTNLPKTIENYLKNDFIKKIISGYKTIVQGLLLIQTSKIEDQELKDEVNKFVNDEFAKLDDVSNLDDLITALTDLKTSIPENVKKIITDYLNKKLATSKDELIKKVNEAADTALAKITDADIKKELTDAKTKALDAINSATDIESLKTASTKILDTFTEAVKTCTKKMIEKLLSSASEQAKSVYNKVSEKLSEESKKAFDKLYNEYLETLSKIEDTKTAAKEAEEATKQFISDSKAYITEALNALKEEYIKQLDEKYNELIQDVEIEKYQTELKKIYDDSKAIINSLSDIDTFITDATKEVTSYLTEIAKAYGEYVTENAKKIIEDTKAKGKDLYDNVYSKEEYTSKGAVAKIAATTAIELAYKTFTTALDNISAGVGAKTACDEAYKALVSAFNSALGITEE